MIPPAKNYKIGVLASTKGTVLQTIIDQIKAGNMPGIELVAVISNKKNAIALERARREGLKTIFLDSKNKIRQEYDEELANLLKKNQADLIVLIGYMRILTPEFIRKFPRRIINVHPAILPKFGGAGYFGSNVHKEVLKNNEKESGCTIHFVDEVVDGGEIILQKKVAVANDETEESLKEKVQALEKKWYPEVIKWFAEGKIK